MKHLIYLSITAFLLSISGFTLSAQSGDYAVQLAAFNQKVPLSYFSGFDGVYEQRSHGTMYKYLVSGINSESDADALKTRARSAGFKNARVINLSKLLESTANCCMDFTGTPKAILIQNLFFDFDKSVLRPKSKTELNKLMEIMRANPGYFVEVRAHTDAKGSNEYNNALSKRRSDAAVNYLKRNGISAKRIESKTFGEVSPIAKNEVGGTDTPTGRQLNRRVELVVKNGSGEIDVVEDIQVPDNLKVN